MTCTPHWLSFKLWKVGKEIMQKKKKKHWLFATVFEPICCFIGCRYWPLEENNDAFEKDKMKKKGFLIK